MRDEILNQEEINKLISQFRKEGTEAIKKMSEVQEEKDYYQEYDFNRPDKFTSENIRTLESIGNSFARGVSLDLSGKCRYSILLKMSKGQEGVSPIEQIPFGTEYVRSVGKDQWVFCIINLGREGLGQIILQMNMSFTRPIHQNQLGFGDDIDWVDEVEPFTDIDEIVMKEWIEKAVFPSLKSSFRNIEHFDLELKAIDTDPQSPKVKITMDTDVVSVIPFDVELGSNKEKNGRSSVVQLVIPYMAIESIAERLTTENAIEYQVVTGDAGEEEMIKKHLELIPQKVDIELGKSVITIRELLALEEGDVLELNQHFKKDLKGYISTIPKFSCKPGRKDERYAVRITGFAKRKEKAEDE